MPYRYAAGPLRTNLRVLAAPRARSASSALLGELELAADAVLARDACVLDFAADFDACVLRAAGEDALVITQGRSSLVLYGADLGEALSPSAWRERCHRLRGERARHFAYGVLPHVSWPPRWSVSRQAVVRGYVERGPALERLAEVARERAAQSDAALLCLPAAHGKHPALRVDADGVLHAFGVAIDTRRDFVQRYVWALGRRNERGDADALVLEQRGEAVCLSMNARPGGWPSLGALPAAAPELPTPELPVDELITPAAFAALDAWLASLRSRGI